MQDYQRDFLDFALDLGVLRFGQFTLKSGRVSPYFFNAGLFNSGAALARLGRFYAQTIVDAGLEARLDIAQTVNRKQSYGQLDEEQAVTEVASHDVYVVPDTASDLAIPLGSIGTASALFIANLSSTDLIQYKLGGTGNTAMTLGAGGFALFKGQTKR